KISAISATVDVRTNEATMRLRLRPGTSLVSPISAMILWKVAHGMQSRHLREIGWNRHREPAGTAILDDTGDVDGEQCQSGTVPDQDRRAGIAARCIAIVVQEGARLRCGQLATVMLGEDVRLVLAIAGMD